VEADETPEFDPSLWFPCSLAAASRDYLVGNAHTFRGRMLAYCERKEGSRYYYVSASEVLPDCSDAARWWVKGFLAGAEPEPPRDQEGDYLPFDHPEMVAWRRKAEGWADAGTWPSED
jgi:hypothetical protein